MNARCAVVIVVTAVGFANPARACSCGHRESPAESLVSSSRAFEGQAMWLEPVFANVPHVDYKMPLHRWRFRVLAVWKGGLAKEAAVVDAFGNCSYRFQAGRRYLIFASPHPTIAGDLETTICTATTALQDREANPADLASGTAVQTALALGPEPSTRRVWRVLRSSAFAGWALLLYRWRELTGSGSLGAVLAPYVAALLAIAGAYFLVRSAMTGHFRKVSVIVASLVVVAGVALLISGFRWVSANPYLNDLVRLGG